MRLLLAFKLFFKVLFNAALAEKVRPLLTGAAPPTPAPVATPPKATAPAPKPAAAPPAEPGRSEALTLLAALQREARFLDFLQESLAEYDDAQVGAAVRDIHRDCTAVVERMFAVRPVVPEAEGATVAVPADTSRYRLTGNVSGQPPFRGQLVHHGWLATKCELPAWTGPAATARILAPAEVELK